MKCRNQRVFIIGASSALGTVCAETFAREGASVLLCGNDYDRLNVLSAKLRTQFLTQVLSFRLDVADPIAIKHTFADLSEEWLAPDIIINFLEITPHTPCDDVNSLQKWLATHLDGIIQINQRLLIKMQLKELATIVNVNFIDMSKGNVDIAKFIFRFLEKYKLDQLIKSELKNPKTIRISTISPESCQDFQLRQEVADAILFCVTRPSSTAIAQMCLKGVA